MITHTYDDRCNSPQKVQARVDTILNPALAFFGGALPIDKQYHTLCAHQTDSPYAEINHLVSSGLIQPEQYYGIDYNEPIVEENKIQHPKAHFTAGDFYTVLSSYQNFNPGIIYYDSTGGIKKELENIGYILNLLHERDITNVMVVFNVIMTLRGINDTGDTIMDAIEQDSLIQQVLNNDDKFDYSSYPIIYPNGNTQMFTIQFTR